MIPYQLPLTTTRPRTPEGKGTGEDHEAVTLGLLNHPHICSIQDVVRTKHHLCMLLEYISGGQLLDLIIEKGRLKEKEARKLLRQIASALDYCHQNNIVHRDIKLEHIVLTRQGDVKIIDFRLSSFYSPQTRLKTFCGTSYFAAPEMLQAKPYIGPEVDVWSFGIVFYIMVCGRVPFDDRSISELCKKILERDVEYPLWLSAGKSSGFLSTFDHSYSDLANIDCKNLLGRMLVKDPSHRASLQEVMSHPWMMKGLGSWWSGNFQLS
jgi:serine/threonine protein kinase KIN1/2